MPDQVILDAAPTLLVLDTFKLLDDLQEICHDGCTLDDYKIGAIQGKLMILRINLNVHCGLHTEQRGKRRPDSGVAAGLD